jgi:hypothetical protein
MKLHRKDVDRCRFAVGSPGRRVITCPRPSAMAARHGPMLGEEVMPCHRDHHNISD